MCPLGGKCSVVFSLIGLGVGRLQLVERPVPFSDKACGKRAAEDISGPCGGLIRRRDNVMASEEIPCFFANFRPSLVFRIGFNTQRISVLFAGEARPS